MWMDVDDFASHRVVQSRVLKPVEKSLSPGVCVLELEDGAWVDQFLRQ